MVSIRAIALENLGAPSTNHRRSRRPNVNLNRGRDISLFEERGKMLSNRTINHRSVGLFKLQIMQVTAVSAGRTGHPIPRAAIQREIRALEKRYKSRYQSKMKNRGKKYRFSVRKYFSCFFFFSYSDGCM